MHTRAWQRRLEQQLPGWVIWAAGGWEVGVQWHAAPGPAETPRHEVRLLPNRVSSTSPIKLRKECRERYGWDDHCESCGVLARECGHRQPEREKS